MINFHIDLNFTKVHKGAGISPDALECSKAPAASHLNPQSFNPADPLISIIKLE